MKLALVGATGLVGSEMIKVLEEYKFAFDEFIPAASARSVGKPMTVMGKNYKVVSIEDAIAAKPDIALFSAVETLKEYAPKFAEVGTTVIDNSSAWRMDPSKKLVVPEINAHVLTKEDKIIANPNCSTIQMVLPLKHLHEEYKIKRIVVSTYQSVTGTGIAAVQQMNDERAGKEDYEMAYPYKIDMNVLPHIDVFFDNGYTKEEMKMTNETKKIFDNESIKVTATTVRIPTMGGHSEAVNIEFEKEYDDTKLRELIASTPGCIIQDDPKNNVYPMPINAHEKNEVFVGRIRRDETQEKTVNMWIVADNLRKGAATNAVQIAQYLVKNKLVG